MNTIKLRKDYQEITKDLLITPLISEKDFIIKFLKKELERLNNALKTWSDDSKILYKSKYKRILKDKEELLIEIESLEK